LADAKGLDPSRSRCILAIDSSLINADPGGHTVVLRGPIIENSDMTVSLTLWTWTYVRPFLVARGAFEDMYDGAVVGYF